MTPNSPLVISARKYIDVPFHWHGRNAAGLDCIGLILRVLWDCGYSPPDFHDYGNNPVGTVVENLEKNCIKISPGAEEPGDIIALQAVREDAIQHCGFLALDKGYPTMIHCAVRRGVTENRLESFGPAFRWIQP